MYVARQPILATGPFTQKPSLELTNAHYYILFSCDKMVLDVIGNILYWILILVCDVMLYYVKHVALGPKSRQKN